MASSDHFNLSRSLENIAKKDTSWGLLMRNDSAASKPLAQLGDSSIMEIKSYLRQIAESRGMIETMVGVVMKVNFTAFVIVTENVPVPLKYGDELQKIFLTEVENSDHFADQLAVWYETCTSVSKIQELMKQQLGLHDDNDNVENDTHAESDSESAAEADDNEGGTSVAAGKSTELQFDKNVDYVALAQQQMASRDKDRTINNAERASEFVNRRKFFRVDNAPDIGKELVDLCAKLKLFYKRLVSLWEGQIALLPTASAEDRHVKAVFTAAIGVKNMKVRDGEIKRCQLEADFGIVNEPLILCEAIFSAFQSGYNQEHQVAAVKLAGFTFNTKVVNFVKETNMLQKCIEAVDDSHPQKFRLNEVGRKGWLVYFLKKSSMPRYRELGEQLVRMDRESEQKNKKPHFDSFTEAVKWLTDCLGDDTTIVQKRQRQPSSPTGLVGGAQGDVRTCFQCGLPGHIKSNCNVPKNKWVKKPSTPNKSTKKPKQSPGKKQEQNPFKGTCNNCGETGHMGKNCPKNGAKQSAASSAADGLSA
jgi:hypothetical protein